MSNKDFVLTDDNYFSPEANRIYMGSTQFKSFSKEYGGCEAKALAELNGTWESEENNAFLVGSYVHANFEGTLSKFKAEHPTIFTKQGELKAEFRLANEMINALETDEYIMRAMNSGEKEVFMTGEFAGAPWKIKVDCLDRKNKIFIDLKTTKDFEHMWSDRHQSRVNFILKYNYVAQFAIYQEIIRQNTGQTYMPYLIAVTKQSPPDKAIVSFDQQSLDDELKTVALHMKRVLAVKTGQEHAVRCNTCDYCRATKKVDLHGGIQHFMAL